MSAPHADLSSLRDLRKGWDSYDGEPITDAAIRTAEHVYFVPLSDGGIQIELHASGRDIEVEIAPDGSVGEICDTPATTSTQRPCPHCDGTGHGEPLGDQSGYVPCATCGGTGEDGREAIATNQSQSTGDGNA